MACITDAGQNSQGGRSFFYWYSADIEQQFACFSSSSASGAALSRAGHDCSAAYSLDGRLTSALTGLWSTSLLRAAFTVQLLHRSTANRPMTQNTRSLQRLGGGGCTEKRKVFSWWLPARSTLTCGSRQLLNHLSFQSTLTRSLWIMVWTFQIRTIFLKVFYWVTHLVHFLFRLYQCSAGVCFDFLACSNAACSFLENCTSKILHTQQWLQSTYWKINTEPQIS